MGKKQSKKFAKFVNIQNKIKKKSIKFCHNKNNFKKRDSNRFVFIALRRI